MSSLSIDALLPALREALGLRHGAVLEAPPVAGKTTRVPLALGETVCYRIRLESKVGPRSRIEVVT